MFDFLSLSKTETSKPVYVVKIDDYYYQSKTGAVSNQRRMTLQKRLSTPGYDFINEEISNTSVKDFVQNIENFNTVEPGLYYIRYNSRTDWFGEEIDVSYFLVPFRNS